MSEYQYYEFQAVDRPLGAADQQALRELSTRARITATSFTNSYEWGSFKGDPAKLMERWFDLHFYLANWGTRRLMIRLPMRLVDRLTVESFIAEAECVTLRAVGGNLILDIERDEVEPDEDWEEGSGWLAALAPLRADLLAGDQRLFYLLWLTAVEADAFADDHPEPTPGCGPMTGSLQAFVTCFGLDPDLVEAAAERPAAATAPSPDAARKVIEAMTDAERTGLLMRLFSADPHVAAELQAAVRRHPRPDAAPTASRTVGELRARAEAIGLARENAAVERAAAERKRREEEEGKARWARFDAILLRGESVWREIETEVERSNAAAYDRAASLLVELHAVAVERGTMEDFIHRLRAIRQRHARKGRFIERLSAMEQ